MASGLITRNLQAQAFQSSSSACVRVGGALTASANFELAYVVSSLRDKRRPCQVLRFDEGPVKSTLHYPCYVIPILHDTLAPTAVQRASLYDHPSGRSTGGVDVRPLFERAKHGVRNAIVPVRRHVET
eukprot:2824216-Pyramimonas_sp.AAC.1